MTMNKKAISVMVGYVLLISAAVVMGVIVYQSLKTYVPIEPPMCPEEVSLYIKSYDCGVGPRQLSVNLENNGRFDLAGYFIYLSNMSNPDIATFDLSSNVTEGGIAAGGAVMFVTSSDNPIGPGDEVESTFNLTGFSGEITLIEVVPARFEEIDGRISFVSCGESKVQERTTGCVIQDCIDSDGDNDIMTAGTCIDVEGYNNDFCPDPDDNPGVITELFCHDNQ